MRSRACWLGVGIVVAVAACQPPGYGKDGHGVDGGSGGSGAAGDAAVAGGDGSGSGSGAGSNGCDHAFRLDQFGESSSVWLSGDFLAWAATPAQGAIVFVLGADSGWTGSYDFAPGTYAYKFIIDGTSWIDDPTNTDTMSDGMGNTNSVYVCAP